MSIEDELRRQLTTHLDQEPPPDLVRRSVAGLPSPRQGRPPVAGALRTGAAALAIVLAVLVVAPLTLPLDHVQPGGATRSVAPQDSASAAVISSPATDQPDAASPTPVAVPPPTLSADERSAYFWGGVTRFLPYSYESDTLRGLTETAHLVVRGRIVDFNPGQLATFSGRFGPSKTTIATIVIDEVLKGAPISRVPGSIEVARLGWSSLTSADAPAEEAIFFLWNYAQLREDEGVGSADPENERYYYTRLNGYQCILPLVDGKVQVIAPVAPTDLGYADRFPGELDERPADEVAEDIRTFAEVGD